MRLSQRLGTSTVIASAALFFALGGSAFALGDRVLGSSGPAAAQKRCAPGSVRGVAVVTGDPAKGLGNLSGDFTGDPKVFARRFSCTGKGVTARRVSTGVFEVQFVGNSVDAAVGNALYSDEGPVQVAAVAPGVFRVTVRGGGTQQNVLTLEDKAFVVVAV